jgi:hypothetical protein
MRLEFDISMEFGHGCGLKISNSVTFFESHLCLEARQFYPLDIPSDFHQSLTGTLIPLS